MDFDEMKKIWDVQNNEPLYAINEPALHRMIIAKKNRARHITHVSELLLIIVNFSVGSLIVGLSVYKPNGNFYALLLAVWMLISGCCYAIARARRLNGSRKFDRSMRGDLAYGLSVATYQVKLSQFGRWGLIPFALFTTLSVWEEGKSAWSIAGVLIFFLLTAIGSRWEHKFYKRRKRELEILKSKLEEEN